MSLGFTSWKDVLEILVVPIAVFAIGALLPSLFDAVKARKFLALIRRELEEMGPQPEAVQIGYKWHQHLGKRFVHEEIFRNVSDNRDFILSLPPDVVYNLAQLWAHFDKAAASQANESIAEHGASWCDYLRGLCWFFDRRKSGNFRRCVYEPWEQLILAYHPELRESERLPAKQNK